MSSEADWKLPWEGGCRCGETRVRVTRPPLITFACHCLGCQAMSASAFSLNIALPSDGLEVLLGEPVLGGIRKEHRQYYCPSCKSWMFTRPARVDWLVNLRSSVLDEHHWSVPFIEVFTSEKLHWATTPARYSFETAPEPEAFEPLIAAFAEEGVRPQ
jgi:hypothetical protein